MAKTHVRGFLGPKKSQNYFRLRQLISPISETERQSSSLFVNNHLSNDGTPAQNPRNPNMLTNILSTLYLTAGIVGNIAYLPTLRDLWLLKPAANLQSYGIWSLTSLLVFAYAVQVNGGFVWRSLHWNCGVYG